MWASYIFHFSTRIQTSTHTKVFNIFFALYMSRCPTFTFQLSIMSKCLAKHISTKVSFMITIRKRHDYIDIRWPWIWNQYFYLGIWNFYRTNIIVLPSFQLATQLNSQNRNENEFINELWHISLYMNIGISNWHNWSFDPRKMMFFNLFQFLTRLLTSKYLKIFSTFLMVRNGAMWITCFSAPQNAKNVNHWPKLPSLFTYDFKFTFLHFKHAYSNWIFCSFWVLIPTFHKLVMCFWF